MKDLKKNFCIFCCFICVFLSFSCSADVTIELKKDGTTGVAFDGNFGEGLVELINSISEDDAVFDTNQITFELAKSGFSDVNVTSKGNKTLLISMNEKNQKSYLFTSGVCSVKQQRVSLVLSPKTLKDFYSNCDEQIVLYLDLLLAPVFNDEKMTEDEYIETLGTFYGNNVAKEFEKSEIKIKIKNPDGKSKTTSISVPKLLTLQEVIVIE